MRGNSSFQNAGRKDGRDQRDRQCLIEHGCGEARINRKSSGIPWAAGFEFTRFPRTLRPVHEMDKLRLVLQSVDERTRIRPPVQASKAQNLP